MKRSIFFFLCTITFFASQHLQAMEQKSSKKQRATEEKAIAAPKLFNRANANVEAFIFFEFLISGDAKKPDLCSAICQTYKHPMWLVCKEWHAFMKKHTEPEKLITELLKRGYTIQHLTPCKVSFVRSWLNSFLPHDKSTSLVSVIGPASLAGTLEIDLAPNTKPGKYTLLTSSGITGIFDSVTFTGTAPNYTLSYLPIGNPTFVQLDFLSFPATRKNLTLRRNLYSEGDIHIDRCSTLFVSDIEPNPTDCAGDAHALSIGRSGLNVSGNACVQGTLLCNQIDPVTVDCVENERCASATNFSGDIRIRETRIIGKVPHLGTIRFNNGLQSPVLGLHFDNCNTDVASSNVGTGALVTLKISGVSKWIADPNPKFFDLSVDLTLYVGPEGYLNSIVTQPIIQSGLNNVSPFCNPEISAQFCYGEDPCALCILLTFNYNTQCPGLQLDYIDAIVTYDIISNNLTVIDCECSSLTCE